MRFIIVITTIILSMTGFAICGAPSQDSDFHSTSLLQDPEPKTPNLERNLYVGNWTLYPAGTRQMNAHAMPKNKKLKALNGRIGKLLPALILDSARWKALYESGTPEQTIPTLCGFMRKLELRRKVYLRNAAAWNQTMESITKGKDGDNLQVVTMPITLSWPTTDAFQKCRMV
ncbi:hypothetical protein JOM56_005568 [Amanita muscaria]